MKNIVQMLKDDKCTAITPEVLADNYLEATIERTVRQARQGYIKKTQASKLLKRSRRTLDDWDKLLTSTLDDWSGFKKTRQYNLYQFACLEKLSKYQTRERPFRPLSDLVSYVNRNINSFTLDTYFNQF